MVNLPSGTVTFLFTDIEGSTTRWEQHPEAMGQALARHDELLRRVIGGHDGHVFKTVGDAFCAVFTRPTDALEAAIDAQLRLRAEAWGEMEPLRVRIAMHTGVAEERDDDYFGPSLNRVARLLNAGHGGQILVSEAVATLIRDSLPRGSQLLDLGERRFKDLTRSERVFQVSSPGLDAQFPPLRSLDGRSDNLPIPATPLVGRSTEVATARETLLRTNVRLLTLTGPGGTGKTRLALEIAARVRDEFSDGVQFVELASTVDPALVPSAIAQGLGIPDAGGRSVLDTLKVYLHDRELLIILDNFEQVISAAPGVSSLLEVSPRIKMLVTSRVPLHVRGEHEIAVSALRVPDLRQPLDAKTLSQYAAVALFLERAAAIKPDFTITSENAAAVADICARLDGLPLAIELAASRIRLLSPEALLARLENRLNVLTGGARDLPDRQRTLRGAIAWGYDLLDETEQALFRRMSLFAGGCSLDAAEAVCGHDLDVFDGLDVLVANSLVRKADDPDGEPRFWMLQTIREYGLEQLEASGDAEDARDRHLNYFLSLAEAAESNQWGARQTEWWARLESDYENIRAALEIGLADQGTDAGLRLAGALSWFWFLRGHWNEGRTWLARSLDIAEAGTTSRAKLLCAPAPLIGDVGTALRRLEESVAIYRDLQDSRGLVTALFWLGLATLGSGDEARAELLCSEGLTVALDAGDRWGRGQVLNALGRVALHKGDLPVARARLEEGLAVFQSLGDRFSSSVNLVVQGDLARAEGDYGRAGALYEESLPLIRQTAGRQATLASALQNLAYVVSNQGDQERSVMLFEEALTVFRDLGDLRGIAECLAGLGGMACARGDAVRSARVFGAAESLLESIGATIWPSNRADYERSLEALRRILDPNVLSAEWAGGRAMSLEQAIRAALDETWTTR